MSARLSIGHGDGSIMDVSLDAGGRTSPAVVVAVGELSHAYSIALDRLEALQLAATLIDLTADMP